MKTENKLPTMESSIKLASLKLERLACQRRVDRLAHEYECAVISLIDARKSLADFCPVFIGYSEREK